MSSSSPFHEGLVRSLQATVPDGTFSFEERESRKQEQTLIVGRQSLLAVCSALKNEHGFTLMLDLCGVDWPGRESRFDVVYHLLNPQTNERLRVKTRVGENEGVASVTSVWAGANWFERETFDMFGLRFDGHPDLRRILCHHEFQGHPLRKDYPADLIQPMSGTPIEHVFEKDRERMMAGTDEDWMWLNIGPAHPATHGTLRFMAVVDGGENIKAMDLEIGYLHRCFEKMCETHNYNQVIPYTDRLNYCSAPMNNNCYAAAIEKMFGVQIPPRATMMRMILDELSRIIDHFVCMGTNVMDTGALTTFFYVFQARERVYELFEKLCGARLTVSLTRIGGQGFDLPAGWVELAKEVVEFIDKTNKEFQDLIMGNRIFLQRTKGAGPISQREAIDWGFTGPCLRATGSDLDLRKTNPYYFYSDVEFDIPVGKHGDTLDRFYVRLEEVRQSVRILRWCLKNIPEGPIAVEDKAITLPPKERGLRQHRRPHEPLHAHHKRCAATRGRGLPRPRSRQRRTRILWSSPTAAERPTG